MINHEINIVDNTISCANRSDQTIGLPPQRLKTEIHNMPGVPFYKRNNLKNSHDVFLSIKLIWCPNLIENHVIVGENSKWSSVKHSKLVKTVNKFWATTSVVRLRLFEHVCFGCRVVWWLALSPHSKSSKLNSSSSSIGDSKIVLRSEYEWVWLFVSFVLWWTGDLSRMYPLA